MRGGWNEVATCFECRERRLCKLRLEDHLDGRRPPAQVASADSSRRDSSVGPSSLKRTLYPAASTFAFDLKKISSSNKITPAPADEVSQNACQSRVTTPFTVLVK